MSCVFRLAFVRPMGLYIHSCLNFNWGVVGWGWVGGG
jgi:hypothetical protein